MAEFFYAENQVEVTDDILTPSLCWEARHEMFKEYIESHRIFEAMTDDEREAVIKRVRRSMEIMYDNVEEWLPDSFSLDDVGATLTVKFHLILTNIKKDTADEQRVTSYRLKEAAESLLNMLANPEVDDET